MRDDARVFMACVDISAFGASNSKKIIRSMDGNSNYSRPPITTSGTCRAGQSRTRLVKQGAAKPQPFGAAIETARHPVDVLSVASHKYTEKSKQYVMFVFRYVPD